MMSGYMLTYDPKRDHKSNSHFYQVFEQDLIPGKIFSVSESYDTCYSDGYTNDGTIVTSQLFLRVVSVSPPQFRGGFLFGRVHWEEANATVELPSGKSFPLFVYHSGRNGESPHLALNDIVYQELKKARYERINLPGPQSSYYLIYHYGITPCSAYLDNSRLIKAMQTVKEKQQAFKERERRAEQYRVERAYLDKEAARRNAALQNDADELFRKM